ncbi:MAG: DUF2267 domain-containing protein [Bacteroidetes bacterium]|jgi:uncharacterized protein (DUF2267 family)|nr:DUF2267 domain-containing protein [Bacteroidota bacterium]
MQIKDYYIPIIHTFEFIDTEEEAENSVKTVLGMLVSSVSEDTAQEFAAQLPDWLDYETLRGDQQNPIPKKPEDCIQALKNSYGFNEKQATALMHKTVALTVQEGTGDLRKIILELPDEWEDIFNQSPKQQNIKDETVL